MDDVVGGYLAQSDRLLAAACALFPVDRVVPAVEVEGDWPEPAFPEGMSGLVGAAEQASTGYRQAGVRVAELTAALNEAVTAAAQDGERAGAAAAGIREAARSQGTALRPATDTPEGVGLLVASMDERLAAMQEHIVATREQMRASAERIRQCAVELAAVRVNG